LHKTHPISYCYIANAIDNPAYYKAELYFSISLPHDQLLTKIAASLSLSLIQYNAYLYALLTNPGIDGKQKNDALDGVSSPLTAAGFALLQQQNISFCIRSLA